MDPSLIDRIYECAFAPELWPDVLDELAKIAGARGGHIFTADREVLSWAASPTMRNGMALFVQRNYLARSERRPKLLAARHPGFMTEPDLYTAEELERDVVYSELLWPAGLGWCASTEVALPDGRTTFLTVERERARGPVEPGAVARLDALRPHLARTALLSARLAMEGARVVGETLGLIGLPALVFDAAARVLAANALIEASGAVRWRARDRVSLTDRAADALFQQALATLQLDHAAPRSFVVRGTDAVASLVGHVIPIRGSARDVFGARAGVLVLAPVGSPSVPAVELIRSLFDLTPAEAGVARGLGAGRTLDEVAADRGVSRNTIRTQLSSLLQKTGCRRQAELVSLLGGIRDIQAG
jgi:DNA-binding CsgD family transcriptional regulator